MATVDLALAVAASVSIAAVAKALMNIDTTR
jgi:hypothetical protein